MKHLGIVGLSCTLALTVASENSLGQVVDPNYPSKPVTLIVPYSGGVSLDTEVRLYTQSILKNTGKQFIQDYKPGAGTSIGTAYVAKAVPDGYTLLAVSGAFTFSVLVYKDLVYDNVKDFSPISLLSTRAALLVANPNSPYKNMAEYIAYSKAHPEAINYATSGIGTPSHLAGALLHNQIATKVTFVHYKDSSQRNLDILNGRVDVTQGAITIMGLIRSGKLRALGVTSSQRMQIAKDIPTIAEQGVPGYESSSWTGISGPARLPPAIVGKLNAMFVAATKDPIVVQKLVANDGATMVGNTSEQFSQFIATDLNGSSRDQVGK